jgi:hypothetical protein
MWEPESIPAEATLYLRVHKTLLDDNGLPKPVAFRNSPTKQDRMSTDWEKYATPEETLQRARNPADNIVVLLPVGEVRQVPGQRVEHTPVQAAEDSPGNRAHTDVFGEKTPEARVKFLQIYPVLARPE